MPRLTSLIGTVLERNFDMIDSSVSNVGIMYSDSAWDAVEGFPRFRRVGNDYSFPAFAEWVAIAFDPAPLSYADDDREAMDDTNFLALLSDLPVDPVRIGYRSTEADVTEAFDRGIAIVDGALIVRPIDNDPDNMTEAEAIRAEAIETAQSTSRALSDYPLLDEDAYSAREADAWNNYADEYLFSDTFGPRGDGADVDEDTREAIEDAWEDVWTEAMDYTHYWSGFDATPSVGPRFGFAECIAHAIVDRLIGHRTFDSL